MVGKVAELKNQFAQNSDNTGKNVGHLWSQWNWKRQPKIKEWNESRNYVFATSTQSTSNAELPWKNSTTVPKLCQIRDNLHANYLSTLFPNANWFKWEGESEEDEAKALMIEGFMRDLTERAEIRGVVSQLLLDYIDTGNVFASVEYVRDVITLADGRTLPGYEGPRITRISPMDICFNPTAPRFEDAPKIVRKVMSIGEIARLSTMPGQEKWADALTKMKSMRGAGSYSVDDWHKALGFEVDGFGDLREYYGQEYVEVLEFFGDYYDNDTGTLHENQHIVVVDRSILVYSGEIESWAGKRNIVHAPWRRRPDNLYGMGPLDNLVGMQYRLDHLENLKADAMDLMIHPPLVIYGQVEPFDYGPNCEISIPEMDGRVEELGKNFAGVASANSEMQMIEARMEEFAGAPKQAMGQRTPGEKTAFEVQTLEAASGRIFQEKITNFEVHVLEPLLNLMLAETRQRITGTSLTRIHDTELDMDMFMEIEPTDLNGNGALRPRGARHFAENAIIIQNVNNLMNGKLGEILAPHMSTENLAKAMERLMALEEFALFRKNQGLVEGAEQQDLANNLQQTVEEKQLAPAPGGV